MAKDQATLVNQILSSIPFTPVSRVLDIGCGTGDMTAEIASTVPEGKITGIDISERDIQIAQRIRARDKQNLEFRAMNAEHLEFNAEERFDFVISFFCLHFIEKQLQVLKEIRKVLTDRGEVILLVPTRSVLHDAIDITIAQPKWAPYFTHFRNPHYFFNKAEYKALLFAADLVPQYITEETIVHQFTSRKFLSRFIQFGLPHLAKVPFALRDEFMSDLVDLILPKLEQRNGDIFMPFYVFKIVATALAPHLTEVHQVGLFKTRQEWGKNPASTHIIYAKL